MNSKVNKFCSFIFNLLRKVSFFFGWFFLVTIVVIFFDVISRKAGFQLPGLGSTKLQELEWHLHTAIFSFWLGYAYLKNTHVRIDIIANNFNKRKQAFLEFLGCLVFALPYLFLAIYFSFDFTLIAYLDNESSPSANGLPYRWIPKFFIFIGLVLLLLAVISVMLKASIIAFSKKNLKSKESENFFRFMD